MVIVHIPGVLLTRPRDPRLLVVWPPPQRAGEVVGRTADTWAGRRASAQYSAVRVKAVGQTVAVHGDGDMAKAFMGTQASNHSKEDPPSGPGHRDLVKLHVSSP